MFPAANMESTLALGWEPVWEPGAVQPSFRHLGFPSQRGGKHYLGRSTQRAVSRGPGVRARETPVLALRRGFLVRLTQPGPWGDEKGKSRTFSEPRQC